MVRVCQILRLVQGLKLILNVKKFEYLVKTLADTAPVLGSFALQLFLLLLMFSVIAVQLFSMIDLESVPGIDREMGYHVNFQRFSTAFVTLFRCSTGEAWNSIMFESSW